MSHMSIDLGRETEDIFPYRPLGEPNAESIEAMNELDRGEGKSFTSIAELMADLNADDTKERQKKSVITRHIIRLRIM